MTLEGCLDSAASQGLKVRFPEPNELFIDIDSEEDWTRFGELSTILNCYTPINLNWAPSKSGMPKRHVVVTLMSGKTFTPLERIAFQACLGSDRKHELLSLLAVPTNPKPTCFYETTNTR
jgi:hypothetical protein